MQERIYNISFVGPFASGKSTIIRRLEINQFEDDLPQTNSIDVSHFFLQVKDTSYDFKLWDIPGNLSFRNLMPMAIRKSNIVFLVYSLESSDNFESYKNEIYAWYAKIREIEPDVPLVLVANKNDLPTVISPDNQKEIKKYIKPRYYLEISAKTGLNFDCLTSCIQSIMSEEKEPLTVPSLDLSEKKKESCC